MVLIGCFAVGFVLLRQFRGGCSGKIGSPPSSDKKHSTVFLGVAGDGEIIPSGWAEGVTEVRDRDSGEFCDRHRCFHLKDIHNCVMDSSFVL
jgi:hypothetical protein